MFGSVVGGALTFLDCEQSLSSRNFLVLEDSLIAHEVFDLSVARLGLC